MRKAASLKDGYFKAINKLFNSLYVLLNKYLVATKSDKDDYFFNLLLFKCFWFINESHMRRGRFQALGMAICDQRWVL